MNTNQIVNTWNFEKFGPEIDKVMTTLFLMCDKYKVKKVGICMRDDSFKSSKNFLKEWYADSLFVEGRTRGEFINPEKAWSIVEKTAELTFKDFDGSCGNSGQHQINPKYVVPGIYKKINGSWEKVK